MLLLFKILLEITEMIDIITLKNQRLAPIIENVF